VSAERSGRQVVRRTTNLTGQMRISFPLGQVFAVSAPLLGARDRRR
jgi:hypothetical protein